LDIKPNRACQCKGPECAVIDGGQFFTCDNEMTNEDLLCDTCREHKGKLHCHITNKLCDTGEPISDGEIKEVLRRVIDLVGEHKSYYKR
jgi:hypothetical protein